MVKLETLKESAPINPGRFTTDDEIISSIKKLLPSWRKQLSKPEVKILKNKKIGVKTLHKLASNRVLPILDILLWGRAFDKEVSNPLISLLVFSDDPKDTQVIKETIKPFAQDVITEDYLRLLRGFIDRDGHVGSTKVKNLAK